jgi:hypothetical protein
MGIHYRLKSLLPAYNFLWKMRNPRLDGQINFMDHLPQILIKPGEKYLTKNKILLYNGVNLHN